MADRAGQAVDFAYLEAYAAHDRAVIQEVLALFVQQAEGWRLRLTAQEADWADVVHTIKGAARGIGAVALGEVCAQAEQAGAGLLPDVQQALAAVLAAIETYRAKG